MAVYLKISSTNPNTFLIIKGIDAKSTDAYFLMRAIQEVWRNNVSKFFQRHERDYAHRIKQKAHTDIKEVFHCEVYKGTIVGRIDVIAAPHIRVLMHGANPDRKAFVPALGGRVDRGIWGGIPTTYWKMWETFFQREVYALIGRYGFDTQRKRRRHRRRRKTDLNAIRMQEITRIRGIVRSL